MGGVITQKQSAPTSNANKNKNGGDKRPASLHHKTRKDQNIAKPGFEIIEEVFYLLRSTPGTLLASYYVGTLPFVLAILYFWADMSQSAYAQQHLPTGALGLALLFVWMKTWHSIYASGLIDTLSESAPDSKNIGPVSFIRRAARQAFLQTTGLFTLPLALLITPAFPWAYALYQNASALDDGGKDSLRTLIGKSTAQAKLWPKQNILIIWALSPYLTVVAVAMFLVLIPIISNIAPEWTAPIISLYVVMYTLIVMPLSPFGVVIAVNVASAMIAIPMLAKTFLGVETLFAQNPLSMLNSTFFAIVCAMTYLFLDPLIKAAYALRCFYGESQLTGQDLRVDLQRIVRTGKRSSIILLLTASVLISGNVSAQQEDISPVRVERQDAVAPADLDQAISDELTHREYTWRMPRERFDNEEEGFVLFLVRKITETISGWVRAVGRWIDRIRDWMQRKMPSFTPGDGASLTPLSVLLNFTLYTLIAILICVLAVMLYRTWKNRKNKSLDVVAASVRTEPDIEDENTAADELPESGWIAMARDLMDKGEFRLALRAIFLANLSLLADRELLYIAKFKSNRDYSRELHRRVHAHPELLDIFSQSVGVYESVWYGLHEATRELLDQVWATQERLRISVQQ